MSELIFLYLLLLIILVCVLYYKNEKYKEGSYYKITKSAYLSVRYNPGKFGEYLTYKYLKSFEKKGAKFLFNIYIPKKEEETTEIDVLMISKKGLFVFESKNYGGWIFGNDNQKYWYQTLPLGRSKSHKEKFYNPVFQNNTHVKYLKKILGENIPIYSIITFSDRCTLKKVKIEHSNVKVINRYDVYDLISSIYNENKNDLLTDDQVNEIYDRLYPNTQVEDSIKQKHIDNIKNNYIIHDKNAILELEENRIDENLIQNAKENNSQIDKLDNDDIIDISKETKYIEEQFICPLCGSKLVLRLAKKGNHKGENFYGCSDYPKCKYKRKNNTINQ